MFGHSFYHGVLKKYTLLFGTYFNSIQIERKNADETTAQVLAVPISYSPIQKIMALRSREKNPQVSENDYYAINVPRMGFEITSITYDSTRQLQPTIRNKNVVEEGKKYAVTQFMQVPYNIGFSLYLVAKNTEELHQMVEQIVPFFTPSITASTNLIPDMNMRFDIPLELTGIDFSDDYDSDIKEKRQLVWTLSFVMKGYFFGPISKAGVIKKVIVDFYIPKSGTGPVSGTDILNTGRSARLETTPGVTADGKPTTQLSESIPYLQIDENMDYGFVETYGEFTDGRKRNPVTGLDEPIANIRR